MKTVDGECDRDDVPERVYVLDGEADRLRELVCVRVNVRTPEGEAERLRDAGTVSVACDSVWEMVAVDVNAPEAVIDPVSVNVSVNDRSGD